MMSDAARTPRLLIEPLRAEHAQGWFEAVNHGEVNTYLSEPEVTTLSALRTRIESTLADSPRPNERWLNWMVRLDAFEGQPIIGHLQATTYAAQSGAQWGEVAWVFDPRHWGRGYASEAGAWLVEELSRQGVRELWACVSPENERSLRLVERLGFEVRAGDPPRPLASYDVPDVVFVRV